MEAQLRLSTEVAAGDSGVATYQDQACTPETRGFIFCEFSGGFSWAAWLDSLNVGVKWLVVGQELMQPATWNPSGALPAVSAVAPATVILTCQAESSLRPTFSCYLVCLGI